jgi:5'-deoxynucleotidase YfbR-like HD superfamily hydrolase
MENIARLLFEAKMLKDIPRSGYHFLGVGKESVAEHSFMTTIVAYVMSNLVQDVDALKLTAMCLVHDLPEARIGDLNTVQKQYVKADEQKAIGHMIERLPFGASIAGLLDEFNEGKSIEAKLARDADQIAFILELKGLHDIGYEPPKKWLPHILERLKTTTGKELAQSILKTGRDDWWFDNCVDRSG